MSDSRVAELLQEGIAAAKAGRKEEAHQVLLQVVDLDEQNEQAWLWLSGVVESLEDRRICLQNVLSINPDNTHAQAGLRWLEQNAPAPPAAEDDFVQEDEAAEDLCPHCGAPVPSSGTQCPYCDQPLIVTCPACGQYVDVSEVSCPGCGQHLGDFREGASYHLALAQAYLDSRKLERAVAALGYAQADAPDNPQVLETVATLYEKAGRADLAIATCKQAIEVAPDGAALYARLGALYRLESQPDQARAMYERAVQLSGNDPTNLTELARLQIEQEGVTQEAVGLLQRALRANAQYAPAHLLLGDVYASQQNRQQAYRHYHLANQCSPPGSEASLEAARKMTGLQHSSQQRAQLMQADAGQPSAAVPRKRPGCLSVYAILLALGGVMGILSVILLGIVLGLGGNLIRELLERSTDLGLPLAVGQIQLLLWGVVGVALAFWVLYLAIPIGLWGLKNWARIAVIILQVLGIVGVLVLAATTVLSALGISSAPGAQEFPILLMGSLLVGFLIQAFILFWFVSNREVFD